MSRGDALVLQHSECETLGTVQSALAQRGYGARYVQTFAGELPPKEAGDAAGLIVMGGPMGAYEQDLYPYLKHEMVLLESCLKSGHAILGVCLGSQLLAAALGSEVKKGARKEIGWHPPRSPHAGVSGISPNSTAFCVTSKRPIRLSWAW